MLILIKWADLHMQKANEPTKCLNATKVKRNLLLLSPGPTQSHLHLNQLCHSIKAPPEENNLWFSALLDPAGLLGFISSQRDQTPERENRKQGEYIVRRREENPHQGTQTALPLHSKQGAVFLLESPASMNKQRQFLDFRSCFNHSSAVYL